MTNKTYREHPKQDDTEFYDLCRKNFLEMYQLGSFKNQEQDIHRLGGFFFQQIIDKDGSGENFTGIKAMTKGDLLKETDPDYLSNEKLQDLLKRRKHQIFVRFIAVNAKGDAYSTLFFYSLEELNGSDSSASNNVLGTLGEVAAVSATAASFEIF